MPLSAYGKPYTPPAGKVDPSIDMKTAVREQVNAMDAAAYFTLLAKLMKDNPPAAADAPMVAKLAKIGIVPGKDFDLGKLDAGGRRRHCRSRPKAAQAKIMGYMKKARRRPEAQERLDLHDQDRRLRHRLPPAGAGHRHRPRRQPAAGRGLPDVGGGRRRQAVQRRRTSTSCTSPRARCRRSTASGR